ncbi:Vacuolar protein sorting-associated protein 52 [Rhizophlyctis rosea]|nr:Vacuolar protein sorting-associated protein 52 [Rhizophlyctis rosea]
MSSPSNPDVQNATVAEGKSERLVATLLAEEEVDDAGLTPLDAEINDRLDSVLGDLDLTAYELSVNEVDDRITEFQGDTLVREAFDKGVDLREYAKNIENDLLAVEHSHILDYVRESRPLVNLHAEIQNSLGTVSKEIETLQNQSQTLTVKLKNRSAVQDLLNVVLEGIVISPDLIRKICEGEVNEFFLQHLGDLNRKMTYVKNQQGRHIHALKDVGPELERLRLKGAEKSREFLLKKIESLKAPNTNIAIIQQNMMLKYKELYLFLLERYAEAAGEVRQTYVVTVGHYYLASFDKYIKSLLKLQTTIADKLDVIGVEESQKRGIFTGKLALKDRTNVYTLGDRINVLTDPDPGIILSHAAEDQNLKFPFEAIFKSVNRLMMDNASSEYIFSLEFFSPPKAKAARVASADNATLAFNDVFDGTLKLISSTTKQYVEQSFDAVGILLCIRINNQNIRIMQKRRIPGLESFMMAINMLLWPRFQAIMDLHVDSVKKATPRNLLGSKDVHPHYITRRYAEFAASILTLNQGYDDALLNNSLLRVRAEVEGLLVRMSAEFSDKKSRLIFLINNYDLITTIFSEYNAAVFESEKAYFNEALEGHIMQYVEEELRPTFLELMSFVTRAEPDSNLMNYEPERFEKIATTFSSAYKGAINNINTSVMQSFPNFQNGARISQVAFTQLLLYYKRFLTLWDKRFGSKKQRVQPIGMQSVMVEIKKFRSTFQ